jgi:hypothetical protein
MPARLSRFVENHRKRATKFDERRVDDLPAGSAAATPSVPATTASGLRAGFIDVERPATDLVSVHAADCSLALTVVAHLDKSKTSWLSCIAVRYDIHPVNCAVGLKQRTDILLGRPKTQVPDENVFHDFPSDLRAEQFG